MNVNTNALLEALKLSGQDVGQVQHALLTAQMMQALRDNPNPDAMAVMSLLGQINPKYRPMAALARALQMGEAQESAKETDVGAETHESEPFVQRNHFEE